MVCDVMDCFGGDVIMDKVDDLVMAVLVLCAVVCSGWIVSRMFKEWFKPKKSIRLR